LSKAPFKKLYFIIIVYNNGIYMQVRLNLYEIHIKKTRKATDSLSVAFLDICCQLATMRISK
ncbi:hypothetical protein, partial [Priestia megaterium]